MQLVIRFIQIVGMCVIAAVVYGILHDQVTARLCVEYFTVAHARLIDSTDPTVLAFFWGTVATWWVGLPLGAGLAVAYCCRPRKTHPKRLIKPLARLLGVMAGCALFAGIVGYIGNRRGWWVVPDGLAWQVPLERHAYFMADAFSHLASYLTGFLGGLTVIYRAARGKYIG
jgi:hypothetical protein